MFGDGPFLAVHSDIIAREVESFPAGAVSLLACLFHLGGESTDVDRRRVDGAAAANVVLFGGFPVKIRS